MKPGMISPTKMASLHHYFPHHFRTALVYHGNISRCHAKMKSEQQALTYSRLCKVRLHNPYVFVGVTLLVACAGRIDF